MEGQVAVASLETLADWLAGERIIARHLPHNEESQATHEELIGHLGAAEAAARRLACEIAD